MGHQPLNVGPEIASNMRKEDAMDMEEREREREREKQQYAGQNSSSPLQVSSYLTKDKNRRTSQSLPGEITGRASLSSRGLLWGSLPCGEAPQSPRTKQVCSAGARRGPVLCCLVFSSEE